MLIENHMRINLKISPTKELIYFNYQSKLTGAFHKWLGQNEQHGRTSLYSFSQLMGGKANNDGIMFEKGTSMFVTAHDPDIINKVIKGIQIDNYLFAGMKVEEIQILRPPNLIGQSNFYNGSPILIRKDIGNYFKFLYYNDAEANDMLMEYIRIKMDIAGIRDNTLSIKFDKYYPKPRIKMITYKEKKNKASICPVIIKGKVRSKQFILDVGLGACTGIGFGATYLYL